MRVLVTRPSDQAARTAQKPRRAGPSARFRAGARNRADRGAGCREGPFRSHAGDQRPGFRGPGARAGSCAPRRSPASARKPPKRQGARAFASVRRAPRRGFGRRGSPKKSARIRALSRRARAKGVCWRPACAQQAGVSKIVETYDARPVAAWPGDIRAALDEGEIDAVLHYSPRSAAAALGLIGAGAASRLTPFLPVRRHRRDLPPLGAGGKDFHGFSTG